ncbi:MAG: tetratricopeptide repeat protein [Flavobacteriaceae bacterium]|jgi:tetratricopeptide (TPR) repeat protein|nr:tetratricopeptide repeat protein [Flavobacteriaceae bacterium]
MHAQKKELKAVNKLVESQDYATALEQLQALTPTIDTAEAKYQAQYYFLLGKTYGGQSEFELSFEAFALANEIESSNGSSKYTSDIAKLIDSLGIEAVTQAIAENKAGNFKKAASLLILIYNVDKEKNVDYLYYAASSAVNDNNFDLALSYYQELKEIGYTGQVTKYYATDVETGEELDLSEENYILFQKLKQYSNFRTEVLKSKLPEIIKNIALIYVQQERNDLAIGAIKEARLANPLDVGLILTEANLYIQLGDKMKFAELMKEAISKDPNNHILYFNLGVITAEQGNRTDARSYYERAIELDPSYDASYLNLAALILNGETELVDQMNSLGTSRADNVKYEKLQKQRESLFLEAVPVLQKLIDIDPTNTEALTTLKNIFGTVGDVDNFKKVKEKLEALQQ